jgi:uncharacterized membrane protein
VRSAPSTKLKVPSTNQYVSQTGSLRLPITIWITVSLVTVIFIGLIISAPLAAADGHQTLARTIYHAFSNVCHQLPDRSFFIAAHPLAVCARCSGIYLGFAVAVFVYPLVRSLRQVTTPARKWLFFAAAPLAIDWGLEFLGIWHNTHSSRFLTGALLGATAVFFIMPGLMDLSLREWKTTPVLPKTQFTVRTVPENTPSDYSAPHRRI